MNRPTEDAALQNLARAERLQFILKDVTFSWLDLDIWREDYYSTDETWRFRFARMRRIKPEYIEERLKLISAKLELRELGYEQR